VGYAAITGAGDLKARYIIHAASMGLGGIYTTAKSLRTSTAHSLRLASERRLKTIAFPAIGTGASGFPIDECAVIMLGEVIQNLKDGSSLELIYFVLRDITGFQIFGKTWGQLKEEISSGSASA
jgi:O-acetyl-ADP-ribose deacetylase (regulator of RNase III)